MAGTSQMYSNEVKMSPLEEDREYASETSSSEEDSSETSKADDIKNVSILITYKDGINGLAEVLKSIETYQGTVKHVESRPVMDVANGIEIHIRVQLTSLALSFLIGCLHKVTSPESVTILDEKKNAIKGPWFPRHARDLDKCNSLMTNYEPGLDKSHPGYADREYRLRRQMIADIAFKYKYGQPIPEVEYLQSEIDTWKTIFTQVEELVPKYACAEYRKVFYLLKDVGILRADKIPQMREMSAFLQKHTGFTLRPAAGLLTSRDFLAALAFRVFQSTQYVRHPTSPEHTPEPDVVHEMLGHMPLLADPSFAQFSQEIGIASLGASDVEIERLSTVYWYTVEFGLCKENNQVKAYGAGLLSAYGELLHAYSDKPEKRPFKPELTALEPYQDQEYQSVYFIADSFEDVKEKFRGWVSKMTRQYELRYNSYTGRVEILDCVEVLEPLIAQLKLDIALLNNALKKVRII